MTVHAVSNPTFTNKTPSRLHDRATGYGIVRLNKNTREIIFECWPRSANPKNGNEDQYTGWPISIQQEDNYGKKAAAFLPELNILGIDFPVVQVIDEATKEILYTLRLKSARFIPKVFNANHSYTINIGSSSNRFLKTLKNITASNAKDVLQIDITKEK